MPSDDAVRQALLRMGSGKSKPSGGGGQTFSGQTFNGNNGGQRRGGEQMQAATASPDARRRRFSQNEHVPVEYVSRDRQNGRHEPLRLDLGRTDAPEPADDRTGFLERELERERQGRQAVERTLEETKAALTAMRTRVAHLEIDLQEARAQRQAMIDLAQSAAQQSAAAAVQQSAESRAAAAISADDEEDEDGLAATGMVRRGRGRPRRIPLDAQPDAEPEQEPVKWWTDD